MSEEHQARSQSSRGPSGFKKRSSNQGQTGSRDRTDRRSGGRSNDRRQDGGNRDGRSFKPRGSGGQSENRGYRGKRDDNRPGGFRRKDGDDRRTRRDGEDRRPRRDGEGEGDRRSFREGGFKKREGGFQKREGGFQRREGGFQKRDGDRFSRGPRRDNRRDDERGSRSGQTRHRSGGQYRKRDEREGPIQTSLTGSPMPIRMDTKPVTDVQRPWFPNKEDWPDIPKRLLTEIERTAREAEVKEVAAAVMIGTQAFEQGDLDRALEFFAYAKSRAARSTTIREGYGICLYVAGDFEAAQRELQAYVRISGRADHNHIIADCSRATGNGERVPELIDQMVETWKKDPAFFDLMNLIEGLIVLAGYWLEDREQPESALAAINRVALPEDAEITESHLRLWHVQARAADAAGDETLAQAARDEIKAVNPEWLIAMDKWIAGEDIDEFVQPWATEMELPPGLDEEPQDTEASDPSLDTGQSGPDGEVDEDGDILPDTIPDHLLEQAESSQAAEAEPVAEAALDTEDDGSWDPGDDWEDEDWDEEDPEPGIPVEDAQPSLFDDES